MNTYIKLADELKCLDDEVIQGLLRSWDASFIELDKLLTFKKIVKSKMVSGLRQGLLDLPDIFSDLPTPFADIAISKYEQVVSEMVPELNL